MMKNVVSFSLWGSSEVYLRGAVDAIAQVNQYYPGWEARFYLGADVPQSTRQTLIDQGAAIFDGPPWGPWAGGLWRFLAASDPEVDLMISRDVDTQILPREVEAVNEWLASGKTLHLMRDHPKHEVPIMAGMWGCRANHLREMESLILKWKKFGKYGCDQEFLERIIYPRFQNDSWIHSESIIFPGESTHPFPTPRKAYEFVGEAQRGEQLVDLQYRYLRAWIEAGKPAYQRHLPWSFKGRLRVYSRGRWPKIKQLPPIS